MDFAESSCGPFVNAKIESVAFDVTSSNLMYVSLTDGSISVYDVRHKPKCVHYYDFPRFSESPSTNPSLELFSFSGYLVAFQKKTITSKSFLKAFNTLEEFYFLCFVVETCEIPVTNGNFPKTNSQNSSPRNSFRVPGP